MVIKVGQKGMLLNINHAKGEQLLRAAVKWAVHGGNQWTPRKQKKKMEGRETYMIYKGNLSLRNSLWRLSEPGKSLLDEYLDKTIILKGLMYFIKGQLLVKTEWELRQMEIFTVFDFFTA